MNVLTDPVITSIAKFKKKSAAQIVLRWHIQRKTIPLVKTSNEARLTENISVHDFTLSKTEMSRINGIDRGIRLFNPIFRPDVRFNRQPYFD